MTGFGRLPLPRDIRDYPVRSILRSTSATSKFWTMGGHDLRLDQGATGTCEGNAWTACLINGPVTHPMFPAFATATDAEVWARQLYVDATGDTSLQQGAYTRQVLDELLSRQLIGSYHRCGNVEEILQTLLVLGPVCIGVNWYSSMDRVQNVYGNAYLPVDEGTPIRGGHEFCLTGVDLAPPEGPPFVRMENSWGASFGHNGTARISVADLHILYVGDAYTIAESSF